MPSFTSTCYGNLGESCDEIYVNARNLNGAGMRHLGKRPLISQSEKLEHSVHDRLHIPSMISAAPTPVDNKPAATAMRAKASKK